MGCRSRFTAITAQMNGELRQMMNVAADARWTGTVDSLRDDPVRIPELGGAELEAACRRCAEACRRMAA